MIRGLLNNSEMDELLQIWHKLDETKNMSGTTQKQRVFMNFYLAKLQSFIDKKRLKIIDHSNWVLARFIKTCYRFSKMEQRCTGCKGCLLLAIPKERIAMLKA